MARQPWPSVVRLGAVFLAGIVVGSGVTFWFAQDDAVAVRAPGATGMATEATRGPQPVASAPSVEHGARVVALLRGGQFDAAMNRLDALERELDEAAHAGLRAAVIDELAGWVEADRLDPALQAAEAYRAHYLHDAALLGLLADIYHRLGRTEEAFGPLFEILQYPPSPEVARDARARIDALEGDHASALAQRREFHPLVAFYARLLELDPANDRYRLAEAEWLAALEEYDRAEGVLREVGDEYADQAVALAARLQFARAGIPVERHGDRLIVEARISNHPVRLLVDTGATMSSLSPSLLRRLGARRERSTATVVTASGVISAPVYTVDEVVVGEQRFVDHPLLGLELPSGGVDGLLGMDVLGSTGLPRVAPADRSGP